MANKRHRPAWPSSGHKEKSGTKGAAIGPDSTAAWPGPPGPTQPRTRDRAGTPKKREHAKSEGI